MTVRLLADPEALRREAEVVMRQARKAAGHDGRLFLLRSTSHVNDELSRDALKLRLGAEEELILGLFVQAGTLDTIRASVSRFYRGSAE